MSGSRKASIVSGYDLVQSLGGRRAATRPAAEAPPPPRPAPAGSVALPTKRDIACPDCGWESHVMGRQSYAVCPKCRKKIDIVDYTVDIDFSGTIATAGAVRLAPGGIVHSGEIRAAIVDLASRVEGGRIVAWHRLDLRAGAVCQPDHIEFRDLRLDAGARLAFTCALACRRLDVAGDLEGEFVVSGEVLLRAGGALRGSLRCAHLTVEDGASLAARLQIGGGDPVVPGP